jgi:serine/threonine protein kinase
MAEALLALIGLGLAAPGVVDVFLRAGEYVTGRLQESKKAKELAINLRTFYISDEVDLLRLYMKSAQAIVIDPRTEETEKTRLNAKFDEIKSLLQSIHKFTNIVLTVEKDPFHSKRRSALSEIRARTTQCKACIENFRNRVQALKDLHSTESVLLLRPQDFNWLLSDGTPISLNESTHIGLGRSTREIRGVKPEPRKFFYESRPYTQSTKTLIQTNLEVVLQKLSTGSPGVLPLLGFRDDTNAQQFQVIFVLPPLSGNPTTLLSLLQDSEHVPTLNMRVSICVQLAKAALYLHTQGLVHKGIRPDNVAILPSQHGDLEEH